MEDHPLKEYSRCAVYAIGMVILVSVEYSDIIYLLTYIFSICRGINNSFSCQIATSQLFGITFLPTKDLVLTLILSGFVVVGTWNKQNSMLKEQSTERNKLYSYFKYVT